MTSTVTQLGAFPSINFQSIGTIDRAESLSSFKANLATSTSNTVNISAPCSNGEAVVLQRRVHPEQIRVRLRHQDGGTSIYQLPPNQSLHSFLGVNIQDITLEGVTSVDLPDIGDEWLEI